MWKNKTREIKNKNAVFLYPSSVYKQNANHKAGVSGLGNSNFNYALVIFVLKI